MEFKEPKLELLGNCLENQHGFYFQSIATNKSERFLFANAYGETKELEANALLISKAPEMLEELKETIIDLKILKNQVIDSARTMYLWEGMSELIQQWIDRKEQLIKEATEL